MNFLSPNFLWFLLPAVALPIIIHFMNLMRYRRVQWAAIDFLLTSEQRIVRRAKLRQILLMLMRILVLAALVMALAGPLAAGNLAGMLGTRSDAVAVLVDHSMSMDTEGIDGNALERARAEATQLVSSLPRGTTVVPAAFGRTLVSPYARPIVDRAGANRFLSEIRPTACGSDVPAAILDAVGRIGAGKKDGSICVITDLQASGWRAADDEVWSALRTVMQGANIKRVVIVDIGTPTAFNASIVGVSIEPPVLMPDQGATVTAQFSWTSTVPKAFSAALTVDGQHVESRPITTAAGAGGRVTTSFFLPPMPAGIHAGMVEIPDDAVPGDNRFYFLLNVSGGVPVLIVEGAPPSHDVNARASEFIEYALTLGGRGLFLPEVIAASSLSSEYLNDAHAVLFPACGSLDSDATAVLADYLDRGGLGIFFLGPGTGTTWWNDQAGAARSAEGVIPFAPVTITESSPVRDMDTDPYRIGWGDVRVPAIARLEKEGMGSIRISRYFKSKPAGGAAMLMALEDGSPYLCTRQVGRGRAMSFATSAHADDSNLPFTPAFLPLIYRALFSHLGDAHMTRPAEAVIRAPLKGGAYVEVSGPSGEPVRLAPDEAGAVYATFTDTRDAGFYRVRTENETGLGTLVAAINPPPEEFVTTRISGDQIQGLFGDIRVSVVDAGSGREGAGSVALSRADMRAGLGFVLAILALVLVAGESLMAWSFGKEDAV